MPHIQRAIQLHTRIAGLENRVSAIHGVLDRIPAGFILLDKAGKVLALNTRASEILRLNDGLAVIRNDLTAGRSEDTNRLRGLVRGQSYTIRRSAESAIAHRRSFRTVADARKVGSPGVKRLLGRMGRKSWPGAVLDQASCNLEKTAP
jgi:PAS domain-containing protein